MTNHEIDILFQKLEAGTCSPQEELLIEELLEQQALDMGEEYVSFLMTEKKKISTAPVSLVLHAETGSIDKMLDKQEVEMGVLYEEYKAFAQSEKSSTDVSLLIQAENGELERLLEEEAFDPIYEKFIANEQQVSCDLDIDLIVQSHTGSLDHLLEQQENGLESPYNSFLEKEKEIHSTLDVESIIRKHEVKTSKEADVIPLWKRVRRLGSIAAVFLAVFAAIFLLKPDNGGSLADGLTDKERIEAELALEQTLAALGMAKNKLDKGTENMKGLTNLKHTRIFK